VRETTPDGSGDWQLDDVPGAACAASPGSEPNHIVVWAIYDLGQQQTRVERAVQDFDGQCE
jgi:hypothetical protein